MSNTTQQTLANSTEYKGSGIQNSFRVSALFKLINIATISAQAKLEEIQNRRSAVSIGDMFEMQMLMNHLSQLSEMATSVVSAANTVMADMARNIKG